MSDLAFRGRSAWRTLAVILSLVAMGVLPSVGAASTWAAGGPAAVPNTVPAEVSSAKAVKLGSYNPAASLSFVIGLQPTNAAQEQQFLQSVQDKRSPLFHHWLTNAEWASRFGPTPASEQAVVDWARAQSLTVTHRYPNRLTVDVRGSVSSIEKAFDISINNYQLGSRTFYSNDRNPSVPATLGSIVQSVIGLNNLELAHSNAHSLPPKGAAPALPANAIRPIRKGTNWAGADGNPALRPTPNTGKSSHSSGPFSTAGFIDPPNLWNSEAYDFGALYDQGHCCNPFHVVGPFNGSPVNTSIAIATGCLLSLNDLSTFAAQYGLAWHVSWTQVDGANCGDPNAGTATPNFETTLDVEYSTAMSNSFGSAGDTATVDLYYFQSYNCNNGQPDPAGNCSNLSQMVDSYQAVANGNLARNFSTSWGGAESGWGSGATTAHNIFDSMLGQGWSLTDASGDSGAYARGNSNPPAIQYPSADPDLLSAGGTQLALDGSGNYSSEVAWNSGGGGCSTIFSAPSYQSNAPCGSGSRGTPDLSLNASCGTGQAIYVNGSWGGVCGTSEVAPELGGFFAQENSYLTAEGNICGLGAGTSPCSPYGNANVAIYNAALANLTGTPPHNPLYDITSGNNDNGTGSGTYAAGSGYDLATGWGSANMLQLAWAFNWSTFAEAADPGVNQSGLSEPSTDVWYNTDQTVSWNLADSGGGFPASGVAGSFAYWDFDPGDPDNPGTPGCCTPFFGMGNPNATSGALDFNSMGQGCHTVNVRDWDNEGLNSGDVTYGPFCYDTVAPVTAASKSGSQTLCGTSYYGSVQITLSASDSSPGSGVASTVYQIDGGTSHSYSGPFTITSLGSHTVTFHSTDVAGNIEATRSISFTIVAPSISPSPTSGPVGTTVHLTGSNFRKGETVKVYWDSTSTTALGSAVASSTCGITVGIPAPQATLGAHHFIAVGQTSTKTAQTLFTIKSRAILLHGSGNQGSANSVTGTGFAGSETVKAFWNSATGPLLGSTTTTSLGNTSSAISFTIPQVPLGTYKVYLVGQTSHSSTFATFTLLPHLSITPTSGAHGSTAHMSATGYGAGEKVTILWNCATSSCTSTKVLATPTTSSTTGNFSSVTVTIPASGITVGTTYQIRGKGNTTGGIAYTNFKITS